MNIIEKIVECQNNFQEKFCHGHVIYPNYIKLGKKEIIDLEDYFRSIGSDSGKKELISILDMKIIKTENDTFMECGIS